MRWHGNVTHLVYLDRLNPGRSTPSVQLHHERLSAREVRFFQAIGVDGFICWFAKLSPYDVPDTYVLNIQDMAHFGIRNVSADPVYAAGDMSSPGSPTANNVKAISLDKTLLSTMRGSVGR